MKNIYRKQETWHQVHDLNHAFSVLEVPSFTFYDKKHSSVKIWKPQFWVAFDVRVSNNQAERITVLCGYCCQSFKQPSREKSQFYVILVARVSNNQAEKSHEITRQRRWMTTPSCFRSKSFMKVNSFSNSETKLLRNEANWISSYMANIQTYVR